MKSLYAEEGSVYRGGSWYNERRDIGCHERAADVEYDGLNPDHDIVGMRLVLHSLSRERKSQ